jgi:hypothetical protein
MILKRTKSNMVFSQSTDAPPKELHTGPLALLTERTELISSLSSRIESSVLPLLVAVSGLLSTDHYLSLAHILWDSCLDNSDTKILLPVRYVSIWIAFVLKSMSPTIRRVSYSCRELRNVRLSSHSTCKTT